MTVIERALRKEWSRTHTMLLAVGCLAVGITAGWLLRGPQHAAEQAVTAISPASTTTSATPSAPEPSSAQLKSIADSQAAPLLQKLKSDPSNPELLTGIGNLYYDAKQYSIAVGYYQQVLTIKASDVPVRTDMATAYWYMHKTDEAISEFKKALQYEPDNPTTLFNLGLVEWRGKEDPAGAVADWKRLLAHNPNFEQRDQVEKMLSEASLEQSRKR